MNIDDFTQKPVQGRTYAKNEVPPFVIETSNTLLAVLQVGNETVFQGSYSPDFKGVITIDFNGLYDRYLKTLIPSSSGDEITHTSYMREFRVTFSVLVGEDTPSDNNNMSWYVANATLKSSLPFYLWSSNNFLTNQPLEKVTNYESPEWLTWLDLDMGTRLDVRFYPKTGGHLDSTVCTKGYAGCYSANVRYSRLIRMASVLTRDLKGYYDLILYDSKGKETCRQRYIYEERSGREKYFCFVNALGGIDTLICDGENVLEPETTHNIGRFGNLYRALDDTEEQRKWTQNTGMMPNKYRNWVYELLTAKQGAQKYDPAAKDYYEIVVDTSEIAMGDFGQLAEASFGYILNDTVNVMAETERNVDRSLHQSVADEAEELEDLSKEIVAVFKSDGQGGMTTDEIEVVAAKLYVTDPREATEDEDAIYYYINEGQEAAGSFTPGVDDNPYIITKKEEATIRFATQGKNVATLIINYYPSSQYIK